MSLVSSLGGDKAVDPVSLAVFPLSLLPQVRRGSARSSVPLRRRRSVGPGEHPCEGAVQYEGGEPRRDAQPLPPQQSEVRVDRADRADRVNRVEPGLRVALPPL